MDAALGEGSGNGHKNGGASLHCHLVEAKKLGPHPSFGGPGIFKNKEVPNKTIKLVAYVKYLHLTKEGI